jgi:hypothetical protein
MRVPRTKREGWPRSKHVVEFTPICGYDTSIPERNITARRSIESSPFNADRIIRAFRAGALAALQRNGEIPFTFLARHQAGDWGEVDEHDRAENETSLEHGFRLLSAYRFLDGTRIWVITEADRSSTCILLPEEY